MEKGYYAILNKKAKVAYLVGSKNPGSGKRSLKSRLKSGFYRRSGKFYMFQKSYDENSKNVEVIEMDTAHRVFAENSLKSDGYRILGDDELIKPRGNVMVKIPGNYSELVRDIVSLVDDSNVHHFVRLMNMVKGGESGYTIDNYLNQIEERL